MNKTRECIFLVGPEFKHSVQICVMLLGISGMGAPKVESDFELFMKDLFKQRTVPITFDRQNDGILGVC